jgi:hypothetical protein
VEGVSNILFLGFQPTINKKYQEITNKCKLFLTNSKEKRDQTLVHQEIYHPIARKEASKRCAPP